MEQWTEISKEEIDKGLTLINYKKGELQILLAKELVKNDTLNKGIDKLLKKYENKVEQRKVKIIFNKTLKDDRMLELNNQAELIYQEIVQDLKKLKGE